MSAVHAVLSTLADHHQWQRDLYTDLHRHPELSMEETRTAGRVARDLEAFGYDVQRLGGGVVGVIGTGCGPTVLFRADMDALPVSEQTGLPYASQNPGVMHACGHDVHVTAALTAARLLAEHQDAWRGTYIALFQPGEETARGARAMVDAGLADAVPTPDVALAQHVLALPSGAVATRPGPFLSAGDSVRITVYGTGSHGSMPHLGVDPAVLAASIVLRLNTIVSREVPPGTFAVVTVGAVHVGTTSNVIADHAQLLVNIRTYDTATRARVLSAVERIVRGECLAAGSPTDPSFEYYDQFPLTDNDPATTEKVTAALVDALGADAVTTADPVPASEDFSVIPDALGVPYTYWALGGQGADAPLAPNHNPRFAPVINPTLTTGTTAAVAAALAWLAGD